jgi:hypothetical protein
VRTAVARDRQREVATAVHQPLERAALTSFGAPFVVIALVALVVAVAVGLIVAVALLISSNG